MNYRTPSAARQITLAAAVAAIYAVLTVTLPIPQYGLMQIRFAEALTVLPFYFPFAVPGLFVGCVIANLFSPLGIVDVICGSTATLIAALLTSRMKNPLLAPLPPVVCNGVIVGAELTFLGFGYSSTLSPTAFAITGLFVAFGELVACGILGGLLLLVLPKISFFRSMIPPDRL